MIKISDAEEILKKEYRRDNFICVIRDNLLVDYVSDNHEVEFSSTIFKSVTQLGESRHCDVTVYEVILNESVQNRRIMITQDMFRILRGLCVNNALVAFSNNDGRTYRISLLTSKYEFEGEEIVRKLSNPRRYSYSLGHDTKTKTAYKFLIAAGKVKSLDDLIDRFSVEVVNKQFYNEIASRFTELVGGERDGKKFARLLKLQEVEDQHKHAEFAVRLIGRIVFCWFLKEKRSSAGISLMPEEILSVSAVKQNENYYRSLLEPLFFELLNTKQSRRKDKFGRIEIYKQIPYLNGGLFSPHVDDYYKYSSLTQGGDFDRVDIPDKWFERFFEVLSQYNFTVDENTTYDVELSVDPEMLGRIFENLLAEINPETGESAKKSTGSFYTPRPIVDYMVDSSLCEYLHSETKISEKKLKAIIGYEKEDRDLEISSGEKEKIINALYTLTVLDPACGSGAFPIGVLQKIVYLLQELDPEAKMWFDKTTEGIEPLFKREIKKKFDAGSLDYIRKLSVIQKSIFGVDIQPIAVEIARLRCFLSLIIEEEVDDEGDNRGINPLPNLDFKFVIANTLVKLEGGYQTSLFEDRTHISELKGVREEYFNTNDVDRRNELKLEFIQIQKKMLQTTVESYNKVASPRYKLLYDWSPFENVSTEWFDPELMFGLKEFDLIIGNPPYVHLEKMSEEEKSVFFPRISQPKSKNAKSKPASYYETYSPTGDIYGLFYEKGINFLKENGFLTFITSNQWMRAKYGQSLRNYFVSYTNPVRLINLGAGRFSSATVDTNVITLQKAKNANSMKAVNYSEDSLENMSVYFEQNYIRCTFEKDKPWSIVSDIESRIMKKVERIGTPLKEWGVSIYRGILTGYNDAFIIDENKKNELIEADSKSAEIIRPILRGRDIEKYRSKFANRWLIFIPWHFPLQEDKRIKGSSEKAEMFFKQDYPAIYEHLLKYKGQLTQRNSAETGIRYEWYCLQRWGSNYSDDFSKQKIVWGEISDEPKFALDNDGKFFVEATSFFMTGDSLEFLLIFLNSSISKYIFSKIGTATGMGTTRWKKFKIEALPVPKLSLEMQAPYLELLNIIQAEGISSSTINAANRLLYDLFNFTSDEIVEIEYSK